MVARFPAVSTGHYRAILDLPTAGQHRWHVVQGWFGEQDLGTSEVGAAEAAGWRVTPVAAPAVAIAAVGVTGVMVARRLRVRSA
ncbi:MAG: hypothetical protein ACR2HQ_00180 [Ilumatobacteraceae bacterium]